jgi:hypothetical protein
VQEKNNLNYYYTLEPVIFLLNPSFSAGNSLLSMSLTMPQSAESSTSEDLPLAISPSNEQLENINSYLNLILVALVSLANLDSDSITQAAQELALDPDTSDRLACPLLATPVKTLPRGHPFSSSPPLSSAQKSKS